MRSALKIKRHLFKYVCELKFQVEIRFGVNTGANFSLYFTGPSFFFTSGLEQETGQDTYAVFTVKLPEIKNLGQFTSQSNEKCKTDRVNCNEDGRSECLFY